MGEGGLPMVRGGMRGISRRVFLLIRQVKVIFHSVARHIVLSLGATLGDPGYMVESAESKTGDSKAKRTGKNEQESYNERQIKVVETLVARCSSCELSFHQFSPF